MIPVRHKTGKNTILTYNRSLEKKNIGQRLSPASNGIEIAWSFQGLNNKK